MCPDFGGGHAMNAGQAKRKAKEAKRTSSVDTKGKLESIEASPGENGFEVQVRRKQPAKKGKNGETAFDYQPAKKHFFGSHEEAGGFVAKHLAAHAGS